MQSTANTPGDDIRKWVAEVKLAVIRRSLWLWLAVPLPLLLGSGCATPQASREAGRPFEFARDTFAYPNETRWLYGVDPATGKQTAVSKASVPDYTLHCFVMARAAKQFFLHARFAPELPAPEDAALRRLVRRVVSRSARNGSSEASKVVIPGYASLHEFSAAHAAILKEECGGAWQSYFQRGHWRMVFPFSRDHQARMARQLQDRVEAGLPTVVHVVRFPQLTINHALLMYAAKASASQIEFAVYDPNLHECATKLVFDRATRTFDLPQSHSFAGGRVDVYEIYCDWLY